MQKLSKSIGINSISCTAEQIAKFEKTLNSIASDIKNVNLDDAKLNLKFSRENFISEVQNALSGLKEPQKTIVQEYFGFEIKDSKLFGYPINTLDDEKIKKIEDARIRKALKALKPIVEEFSSPFNTLTIEGSKNAQLLQNDLNNLLEIFGELRSIIGRKQHETHAFNLDIHTLKVLQNVCSNPKFDTLNSSDKKILEISALLHDITKIEGQRDMTHPFESAFDAYYIIQKLNLPQSDQSKVYELIRTHNWLQRLNDSKGKGMFDNIAQDIAYDSRHTNTFELAKILCEADLKSVKKDDSYFIRFEKTLSDMSNIVDNYINQLHKTQIILPQTKIPKASKLSNVETKTALGVTNKVLYIDDASDDLSVYGFEKGTTKDNLLALVHALGEEEQLSKFNTFDIIDTGALISSSYIKANDYKVFRNQGVILDVAYDDIHAGYYMDFGTGYSKNIELLKQDYLFYGQRKNTLKDGKAWRSDRRMYRNYISSMIKNELKLSDEEYVEHMEKIKDSKSITDIEKIDKNFAQGLLNVFKKMENGKRRGGRQYNEILVSRPKIQGTFAYDMEYEKIPMFLRKYAQDNDLPILIFGKSK